MGDFINKQKFEKIVISLIQDYYTKSNISIQKENIEIINVNYILGMFNCTCVVKVDKKTKRFIVDYNTENNKCYFDVYDYTQTIEAQYINGKIVNVFVVDLDKLN